VDDCKRPTSGARQRKVCITVKQLYTHLHEASDDRASWTRAPTVAALATHPLRAACAASGPVIGRPPRVNLGGAGALISVRRAGLSRLDSAGGRGLSFAQPAHGSQLHVQTSLHGEVQKPWRHWTLEAATAQAQKILWVEGQPQVDARGRDETSCSTGTSQSTRPKGH